MLSLMKNTCPRIKKMTEKLKRLTPTLVPAPRNAHPVHHPTLPPVTLLPSNVCYTSCTDSTQGSIQHPCGTPCTRSPCSFNVPPRSKTTSSRGSTAISTSLRATPRWSSALRPKFRIKPSSATPLPSSSGRSSFATTREPLHQMTRSQRRRSPGGKISFLRGSHSI